MCGRAGIIYDMVSLSLGCLMKELLRSILTLVVHIRWLIGCTVGWLRLITRGRVHVTAIVVLDGLHARLRRSGIALWSRCVTYRWQLDRTRPRI